MKVVNIDGLRRPLLSVGTGGLAAMAAAPVYAAPQRTVPQMPVLSRSMFMIDDIRRPAPVVKTDATDTVAVAQVSALQSMREAWQMPERMVGGLIAIPMLTVMLASNAWIRSTPVSRRVATQPSTTTADRAATSASSESKVATNSPSASVSTTTTPESAAPAVAPTQGIDTLALQKIVDDFTTSQPVPFGIVIRDLSTGATVQSSPDAAMTSASLYKLFVGAEIYRRIDSGALTMGSGVAGTGKNVEDCLLAMITVSDNTCGEALGSMIGWSGHNARLATLGYSHTSLAQPLTTSAGDVSLLLERLYGGTLLSPSSSAHFLGLLKNQRVNNRLPAGLPAGTVFAHKTGDLSGWVHDAGIVYGPKATYVISVMSGQWSTPGSAPAAFASLSSKIYAELAK
jgi:beta-lactamase class A